jgi:ribosomal protein S21
MAKTAESVERDRKALDLRVEGRSFSSIAKELEFPRAVDANEAFNRALRRCPAKERKGVVDRELKRLDALENATGNGDDEKAQQRARAIKGLRARLLAK